MPRTDMAAVTRIIVELRPVTQLANGSAMQAEIEATETYRVNANTATQSPKMISSAPGTSARRKPAEVAIPLPPLKWSQHVKLCPRIAPRPAQIRNHSRAGPSVSMPNHVETNVASNTTAIQPFKTSTTSTRKPAALPNDLETLVAPIFPLPTLRISIPRALARRKPEGTDPRK